MAGKTMVYDKATGRTYIANFTPGGGMTAHEKLAAVVGICPDEAVGGSVRKDANNQWEMGKNSESLNKTNYGKCAVSNFWKT